MKKIYAMTVIMLMPVGAFIWAASNAYVFPSAAQCDRCLQEMKKKKNYATNYSCTTDKKSHFMVYLPPNAGDKVVDVKSSDVKTNKIKLSAKSIKITEPDIKSLCPSVYQQIESGKKK